MATIGGRISSNSSRKQPFVWLLAVVTLAGGTLVAGTLAADTPAADTLAADTPAADTPAGDTPATRSEPWSGLALGEAIARLQSGGAPILFSSALVHPELRVTEEPSGSSAREILSELLRPHGLAVRVGPGDVLLVVPGEAPIPRPAGIRGRVRDRRTHTAVAGVEVRLDDALRGRSDGDGTFELAGVDAGVYRLVVDKPGFVRAQVAGVRVSAGETTEIEVELLALPTTLDRIDVAADLHEGFEEGGTVLRDIELRDIPNAREPGALVERTPGVIADRVNVGGSENGGQTRFLAPAASIEDNVYTLDGINTTDMAALGVSAVYYDLDQIEEIRVAIGGPDVRVATPGVSVSLVTRRGTNDLRGSARYLLTDSDGFLGLLAQGSADLTGELAAGQVEIDGNEVEQIADTGFEIGGPLAVDRAWYWGSAAGQDVERVTLGRVSGQRGDSERTVLDHAVLKIHGRPNPSSSVLAALYRAAKTVENLGAGPDRSLETTWHRPGPTYLGKYEHSYLRGSKLHLSATLHSLSAGFRMIPAAGLGASAPEALLDVDGVWKNGFYGGTSDRDSQGLELAGNAWLGRRRPHELDFGAAVRGFRVHEEFAWPGRGVYFMAGANFGVPQDLAIFERSGLVRSRLRYTSLWIQDEGSAGRFSWRLGARLDAQAGRNLPGTIDAHPVFPDILPAVTFDGNDPGYEWRSLSPRLALTYAFGESGRTLLRLGFARFAEQLGALDVAAVSPLVDSVILLTFEDRNGDHVWQEDEPFAPGQIPAANSARTFEVDPELEPERTDELSLGLESSFGSGWELGVHLVYRQVTNIAEDRMVVTDSTLRSTRPATAADFMLTSQIEVELPDGRHATADVYSLRPGLRSTDGFYRTTGDRRRRYLGGALTVSRRMNERFTLRGSLSWGRPTWTVPTSYRELDDPNLLALSGDRDGDLYAPRATFDDADAFLQSTWTAQLSGLVRFAPRRTWGFQLAGAIRAGQGYPIPYAAGVVRDQVLRDLRLAARIDAFRTDDVITADLSLEKEWSVAGRMRLSLSLAAFNVFDASLVLRRERDLLGPRADFVEETLAPRIFRLGVRLDL